MDLSVQLVLKVRVSLKFASIRVDLSGLAPVHMLRVSAFSVAADLSQSISVESLYRWAFSPKGRWAGRFLASIN